MGDCASRMRSSKMGDESNGQGHAAKKVTPIGNEQLDNRIANIRQLKYWNRRLERLCGKGTADVSQDHLQSFFDYTELSKETLQKLYQIFKGSKNALTRQDFLEELKKISSASDLELSSVIYNLYFLADSKSQESFANFEKQLKTYVKSNMQQSNNIKVSKSKEGDYSLKTKQLLALLDKRKTKDESQGTIKWLNKNLNFKEFKTELLEGGIKVDEIAAYKQFWLDYGNSASKLEGKDFQEQADHEVKIINWRWCQKLLKYLEEKYHIEGAPKLRRKQTIELESPALQSLKLRKNSIQFKASKIGQDKSVIPHQSYYSSRTSIQSKRMGDSVLSLNRNISNKETNFKVNEKYPGSGLQFRNHPGQIDNYALIGNFQWELKRNIRKEVDYITIKQQTFQKLVWAYGGGPILERRIIQGYIELRPYFMDTFWFTADVISNNGQLENEELIKMTPSDLLCNLKLEKYKNYICYHRNVGEDWMRIEFEKNTSKIMDIFSETSFLVYMAQNAQQTFKRIYTSKYRTPKIGQKYSSATYKIIESAGERSLSSEPISVCVVRDQKKGLLDFIVLNWFHHIKRTITLNQFQRYFTIVEGSGVRDQRKSRAGISNLGNTCYMNAIVQALFSTFKEEQLMSLKGDLGSELKHIYRSIVDRKKSVFPVDFKTSFDKYYSSFQGQDQHDAHQFCLCLFEQLQKENRTMMQNLLESKHLLKTTCLKCGKSQKSNEECFVVTLPLRDFAKKQVKIDYIIENKSIQTITFTINQESTVLEWKESFEKASGAKEYFLCQIQNSVIRRTFNKEDNIDSELYQELQIQNHFLITAYESKTHISDLKLQTKHDFRTFKGIDNFVSIARVQPLEAQMAIKSMAELPDEQGSPKKLKVKMPVGNEFEEKIIKEEQLFKFPEDYPMKEIYIKVINYDGMYNECIGKPFVFRIPSLYPISSVREVLQSCIGQKGYSLRISPPNQYAKCEICKKYNCNSKCFIEKEKTAPICWVDGILDFVAVWQDSRDYQRLIQRQKYIPQQNQSPSKIEQYDKFDLSLKSLLEKQIINDMNCQFCRAKRVNCERNIEIINWPQIFIVHLMRFKSNQQIMKIHTKWKLQEVIQIGSIKYVLRAVLCHIGTSADFGHYITVSDDTCYDDQLVTKMNFEAIKPEEVYMLFYYKIS